MKNKIVSLIVASVLLVFAVAGGTIAYLSDTDYADNVMSIGNVDIVQNEKQWNADHTALEEFRNDKTIYPAIGNITWGGTDAEHYGAYRYLGIENVIDKYVTVKNVGSSPAYVRTILAFDMGDLTVDEFTALVKTSVNADDGGEFSFNGAWVWDNGTIAEINGSRYYIMSALHKDPIGPNVETVPSLLQFYIDSSAESEDLKKLDSNNDGKYSILALTQAVQTGGFSNSKVALEEAFGAITPENIALWFQGR